MAIKHILTYLCDLNLGYQTAAIRRPLVYDDSQADEIQIKVFRDGEAEGISGASVSAYVIRSDRTTVLITGTASGNTASVVLPQECYAILGECQIVIRLTQSGIKSTIFVGTGCVYQSRTDTVVDPGSRIPDIDDLLAVIERAENAATSAEGYVGLIAGSYNPPHDVGDRIIRNGHVYYAKVPIPTDEAWTASHWQQTTATQYEGKDVAMSYNERSQLPDGTDFDSVLTPGNYMVYANSATFINIPASKTGALFVMQMSRSVRIMQLYVTSEASAVVPSVYVRYQYGTGYAWTPWAMMLSTADYAGAVRYDAATSLTTAQKAQARSNIGAAAQSDLEALASRVAALEH